MVVKTAMVNERVSGERSTVGCGIVMARFYDVAVCTNPYSTEQ